MKLPSVKACPGYGNDVPEIELWAAVHIVYMYRCRDYGNIPIVLEDIK
jgi:hypothetical protein